MKLKCLGLRELGTYISCQKHDSLPGSVGFILPYNELKVIDTKTGQVIHDFSIGEILVRRKEMMTKYFNDENETRTAIDRDG